MKRQPIEQEKMFANDISNKGLHAKYKEFMQQTMKKIQLKNGPTT